MVNMDQNLKARYPCGLCGMKKKDGGCSEREVCIPGPSPWVRMVACTLKRRATLAFSSQMNSLLIELRLTPNQNNPNDQS